MSTNKITDGQPATAFDSTTHIYQTDAVSRRTKELGPGVGKRLRQAREASDLTVRGLADRAQLSYVTVQRISTGEGGNAGIGTLLDLARALGVRPCWLAYGEGSMTNPASVTAGILEAIGKLSEGERAELMRGLLIV